MIDTGASGFAFIDETFARHHQLPIFPLKTPRILEVIDGRPISSGQITSICQVPLQIGSHQEQIPLFVTKLGQYPLVLGIPWLQHHDATLKFKDNTVAFESDFCKKNCNTTNTITKIPGMKPQAYMIGPVPFSRLA